MDREWPLLGRTRELSQLAALLDARPGRAVVLAGPPGVGKTRLAREHLRRAEDAGHTGLWIAATRSASELPFGALSYALAGSADGLHEVSADRSEFIRRATAALIRHGGGGPLTVVVDDAHLLDDASAMVLHQLVLARTAAVLLTVRSGDPAPALVTALWKEELATRVEVRGLGSTAIGELLPAVLGGELDPAVLAHLTVRCQGNVLLLREIVLGALTDGALAERDGVWRLVKPLTPSDRLVEFVEIRLDALTAAERGLLEVVAYGEPLGTAELAAFAAEQPALDLERKGWVTSSLNDRRLEVRLRHPVYGDVLRATMPALRTREIARRLADAVEATGGRRREDVLRTMVWRLDAGGGDPERMLQAALIARWRYDFALADRLVRAARTAGPAPGPGFEAELLHGQLLSLRGDAAAAEEHLASLTAPDDSARARLAITRLDNTVFSLGEPVRGVRIAEAAEASVTDPTWRDEIAAHRTGVVIATQGPAAGAAAATPIMRRATGRSLVWASMPAVVGLSRLGRIDEALDAVERGLAAHQRLSAPMDWYPWFHHFLRCVALDAAGRYDEARRNALDLHAEGVREHSLEKQAVFAWQLATSTEACGDPERATRFGREAVTLFRQLGRESFTRSVLPSLATAFALAGRADLAQQALASPELRDPHQPLWTPTYLPAAHAWTAVAAGDHRRGHDMFEQAAALGEKTGDLIGAAAALHAIGRTGDPRAVVDRLDDLAQQVSAPIVAARATHVRAVVARDVDALRAATERYRSSGAVLLAAEAASDTAVLLRRSGRRRLAVSAARLADTLADECGRPRTPALVPADARARLTPAEQETAALAADGHSSKEIAARLVLSARTVDNRLRQVYTKLGIAGRNELGAALRDEERSGSSSAL